MFFSGDIFRELFPVKPGIFEARGFLESLCVRLQAFSQRYCGVSHYGYDRINSYHIAIVSMQLRKKVGIADTVDFCSFLFLFLRRSVRRWMTLWYIYSTSSPRRQCVGGTGRAGGFVLRQKALFLLMYRGGGRGRV